MPGGLLQLSYVGQQDIIISGNPQHNFFKCVFKRHLNFAIEPIRQTIDGICSFNQKITFKMKRAGDMASKLYLELKLPALTANSGTYAGWVNSIGNIVIDNVEIYIGGILYNRLYGEFMEIQDELYTSESKRIGKNLMVGRFEDITNLQTNATSETIYHVEIPFWFSRHISLALPLINLQYHEVEVRIQFRPFSQCVVFDGATGPTEVNFTSCDIWCDYVFFDDTIRKSLAKNTPNYLIEQVQRSSPTGIPNGVSVFRKEMQFNHPVKYLVWFYRETNSENNNDWTNFSARADGGKIATSSLIHIDSNELLAERDESYFRLVQTNSHFTRSPLKYIYVYSFAKNPEDLQPSGTFNFSKVDSAFLTSQIRSGVATGSNCTIYAVNYNVIVFRYGMAALLWSS